MSQPVLAAHLVAVKAGTVGQDPRVRCSTARTLVIRSSVPFPVVADSKVVGSTPDRFRVLTGGLLVIAGNGDALTRPVAQSLLSAIKDHRAASWSPEGNGQASEASVPAVTARSARGELARRSGPVGIALASGAAIALMPAVVRWDLSTSSLIVVTQRRLARLLLWREHGVQLFWWCRVSSRHVFVFADFAPPRGVKKVTASTVARAASTGNSEAARTATSSPAVLIGRVGFAARGVVYLIVGWLALRAAVGVGAGVYGRLKR